ncbi:HAD family hydrolase [Rhizobium leguminosarum]|uniref:HAD family hydrolase n=1 Tax=Rhizobium leguminosarum TaxID=384 RepID=UPI0004917013|nr:HAD-IA family hydrolase [Rhizobium leguminosarum]NEH46109.1 HAD-IA family hydrolase [Rhizobium leguminosarum]
MIIFDFDQTLVDTSPVEHLRARRDWKGVMASAGKLQVYPGITELLEDLHAKGHKLAIVTKSPDMVPRAFIKQHGWPIDIVVGYHDVKRRKPDPEGLLLAMSKGQAVASKTFHVGDQAQDTEASRGANVTAVGVTWGIDDHADLQSSNPDHLFADVAELRKYFLGE